MTTSADRPAPPRLEDGPDGRTEAIRILRTGGIVALPTDTVYGLAAALDAPGAIERLFAVKRRPIDRAIVLLLGDAEQAEKLGIVTPAAGALADAFWPGGLTLVLERRPTALLPQALIGARAAAHERSTIGVRVPDHDAPRSLARAIGPLPVTSANRSGEPEARDADAIAAQLGADIDLILDGGPSEGGSPSTVVDASGPILRILREGAIPEHAIAAALLAAGFQRPVGVGR